MTYSESLAYIASLGPRGWRLGLDRMQAFCERGGLTAFVQAESGTKFVHVAGTNGKGSTTAYLQSLLVEAGCETGAFFSPYVVDPRERIQRNRELISPDEFVAGTEALMKVTKAFSRSKYGGITEFEFKTALGFWAWQRWNSAWVALEVGLGGRFDATNVVRPVSTIIVSIGLDHTNVLGISTEAIAYEKAGIVKPGIPLMLGSMGSGPRRVILQVAEEQGAPVWEYGEVIQWNDGNLIVNGRTVRGITPGIVGRKQGHNLALAVAALDAAGLALDDDTIRRGAQRAYVPGRFEAIEVDGQPFLLDGAHNEDSAAELHENLERYYRGRPIILVTNMLQGHELEAFYRPLAANVVAVHVPPISIPRARASAETRAILGPIFPTVTAYEQLEAALLQAIADGKSVSNSVVVVTGSFYLVGETLQWAKVRRKALTEKALSGEAEPAT